MASAIRPRHGVVVCAQARSTRSVSRSAVGWEGVVQLGAAGGSELNHTRRRLGVVAEVPKKHNALHACVNAVPPGGGCASGVRPGLKAVCRQSVSPLCTRELCYGEMERNQEVTIHEERSQGNRCVVGGVGELEGISVR